MVLTQPRSEDSNVASTPLLALDSVVVDTETTGLDARTARLVQIGAVRLGGGNIDKAEQIRAAGRSGRADPAHRQRHSWHQGRACRQRAELQRDCAGARGVHRLVGPDRPYHRLRSGRAAARIRAGRPGLAPAADAGRARPCRAGAADACQLRSRSPLRVALHRHNRPAHGDRRCARHRSGVHDPGAAAAPARHPHPGRSGSRFARRWGSGGRRRCRVSSSRRSRPRRHAPADRPRRQLRLPPPRARRDERAGCHRAGRCHGRRHHPPAHREEDQLGVRHRRQRRLRHRHRARSPARARHGRAEGPRGAARQHHEKAAAIGAGGRLPLPRHRPHAAAWASATSPCAMPKASSSAP